MASDTFVKFDASHNALVNLRVLGATLAPVRDDASVEVVLARCHLSSDKTSMKRFYKGGDLGYFGKSKNPVKTTAAKSDESKLVSRKVLENLNYNRTLPNYWELIARKSAKVRRKIRENFAKGPGPFIKGCWPIPISTTDSINFYLFLSAIYCFKLGGFSNPKVFHSNPNILKALSPRKNTFAKAKMVVAKVPRKVLTKEVYGYIMKWSMGFEHCSFEPRSPQSRRLRRNHNSGTVTSWQGHAGSKMILNRYCAEQKSEAAKL